MPKTTKFHNTTGESGRELKAAKDEAIFQDQLVLEWFKKAGKPRGTSQCYRGLINAKQISRAVPLTSIRRSVNTLTKIGQLKKTDIKVTGEYGRPEFCWQFVPPPEDKPPQQLELRLA